MQPECAKIQGEVMACADAAGCNYEKIDWKPRNL